MASPSHPISHLLASHAKMSGLTAAGSAGSDIPCHGLEKVTSTPAAPGADVGSEVMSSHVSKL